MPPKLIQGFYARSVIQTLNPDGSLRSSSVIRARDDQNRVLSRAYNSGHIYVVVSHRSADTWVNDRRLFESRDGHHLIELNDLGQEIKTTFLPTGGKDRFEVAQVEVGEDGIYVLGMADSGFDAMGEYQMNITNGFLRAVVMKFDFDHELIWISDSGIDQDIFGSGLQSMEIGNEFVYISSGGTSYNVRSSCAFSNWPYQISSFFKGSGKLRWQRILQASDLTRITDMELINEQWLWVTGSTRGDLTIGDQNLEHNSNYIDCGYNGFMFCLNTDENALVYFNHSEPELAKFPQDIAFHGGHLYILSTVLQEDDFPAPITGFNASWTLQLDRYTVDGRRIDFLSWPTQIRSYFSYSTLMELLWEFKFGFELSENAGIFIASTQLFNGGIDGFYSPPSSPGFSFSNVWGMQRRNIEDFLTRQITISLETDEDFNVFPNPLSSDAFVLEVPEDDVENYSQLLIMDVNGRTVSARSLSGPFRSRLITVDESLSNGLYLVRLVGNKRSKTKKLVLNR